MSAIKISRLVAVGLLFLALLKLPIGYYTFLRIVITGIAAYSAWFSWENQQKFWTIIYIIATIVFNPLIPLYLGSKQAWMPIDIIYGLIFLLSGFTQKKKP